MSTPRISVIIPVFNGATDLPAAIDSALNQQGVDVEVIVINDGSTDATADVIAGYGDRIRAVHQKNQGLPKTRNNGIAVSTGEWIAFLDHDDLWDADKLSRQLETAHRCSANIVYTNALNFGDIERVGHLRNDPAAMPEGDLFENLLMDNFIVVSSAMITRELIDRVGGFTEPPVVVEDWDLWLRACNAGARFAAVPEPVTMYRWRPGSLSKNHERMRNLRLLTIQRAFESGRGQQLSWSVRRKALANVERCSAWFLASSSPLKAIRWYARSLAYWPFSVDSWKGVVKGCVGCS